MTSSEERCAVLDTEIFDCTDTCEYPDGNWVVTSCTEAHPYLCKIKKGVYITNNITTVFVYDNVLIFPIYNYLNIIAR